jgi:uncharacterized Fe-S cluster-containing radical SAM superfamily protein
MKLAYAISRTRNFRRAILISGNRKRGREFIPAVRDTISIETSSVCNLECRFCAYVKKQSPKVTMKKEFFTSCLAQAVDMGFSRVDLTPCTGDVFMDRGLLDKLELLDAHAGILGYSFHTNFTVPDHEDIQRLLRLKKLSSVCISVYGYDPASFKAVTLSTDKVFQRLLDNLKFLLKQLDRRRFALSISAHPGMRRSLRGVKTDMTHLFGQFARAGIPVNIHKGVYNNWGGYVDDADVAALAIKVVPPTAVYKNGACVRLMTTLQIMATGLVNGCACRDADATLRLGDLNATPLREIISAGNPAYMDLIDEQQRGEFRPVCRTCDMYSSIYHCGSGYRKNGVALESLAQFKASLA